MRTILQETIYFEKRFSAIKIKIEEVDLTELDTTKETRDVKFATNFSIDPISALVKKSD